VVSGRFLAFKGPADGGALREAGWALHPGDYVEVLLHKRAVGVVRLNDPRSYDAAAFTRRGLPHCDLFFPDCSAPSDAVAHAFLALAERARGPLAVHCLAGLGRTGTLVALWLMKHRRFAAREAVAWLRIVRPGSVIGEQHAYLEQQAARMHALGAARALGLGLPAHASPAPPLLFPRLAPRARAASPARACAASPARARAALARDVASGARERCAARCRGRSGGGSESGGGSGGVWDGVGGCAAMQMAPTAAARMAQALVPPSRVGPISAPPRVGSMSHQLPGPSLLLRGAPCVLAASAAPRGEPLRSGSSAAQPRELPRARAPRKSGARGGRASVAG
jgi:cell division cycle 14